MWNPVVFASENLRKRNRHRVLRERCKLMILILFIECFANKFHVIPKLFPERSWMLMHEILLKANLALEVHFSGGTHKKFIKARRVLAELCFPLCRGPVTNSVRTIQLILGIVAVSFNSLYIINAQLHLANSNWLSRINYISSEFIRSKRRCTCSDLTNYATAWQTLKVRACLTPIQNI